MKVALYTAIWGRYETPKPLPDDLECHAYLFTDSEATATKGRAYGWCAKVVSDRYRPEFHVNPHGDRAIVTPMMNHKWWKCHPAQAVPDADVSIWIDGSMQVTTSRYVERCLEYLGDDDWAMVPHPSRSCIYTEADYSATLTWRYDGPSILAQAEFYRKFHPAGYGLFATGNNVRRHTPGVIKWGELWWEEILNWSHQDQLSLPVLTRLMEDEVRWNSKIPWHQDWILHPHG